MLDHGMERIGFTFFVLVLINIFYVFTGFENFWSDIVMMIGERPKIYWKACWLFLSPLAISVRKIMLPVFL